MSDRGGEFRIDFTGNTSQVEGQIMRLKAQINALKDAIANFNNSNIRGNQTAFENLNSNLSQAENTLKRLTSQFVTQYSASDQFNIRAIAAMRGQADAIKGVSRELGEQDKILRTGANGGKLLTQSLASAIAAGTGLGQKATPEAAALARELRAQEIAARGSERGIRNIGGGVKATTDNVGNLNREVRHVVAGFDELARGQRGAFVSTVGAALRDSGVGPGALIAGIGALGGLAIGGTLVRDLARINTELGEMIERQTGLAAATGMSVSQFHDFAGAMKLSGANVDLTARSLEEVQRNMLTAVEDPTSKAMEAFRKLGFSWNQLREELQKPGASLRVLEQLQRVSKEMGATPERTQAFTQLFGVFQFAELMKVFETDLLHAQTRVHELGGDIDAVVAASLKKSIDLTHELDVAWEGFKVHVLGGSDMFESAKGALRDLLAELSNAGKTGDWLGLTPRIKAIVNSVGGVAGDTSEILAQHSGRTGFGIGGEHSVTRRTITTTEPAVPVGVTGVPGGTTGTKAPVDSSDAAAEKLYRALMKNKEVVAQITHDFAAQQEILTKLSDFETKDQDQKHKFLVDNVIMSKAEAEAKTKTVVIEEQRTRLNREQVLYSQESAIALLKQKEAQATAMGDLKQVVNLRRAEAELIKRSPYSTTAQRTEADTRVGEAQRAVDRQSFQFSEEGARAQIKANADILKGYEAQQQAAVKLRALDPFVAINNEAAKALELSDQNVSLLQKILENSTSVADATRAYWQLWDEGIRRQTEQEKLKEKRADLFAKETKAWDQPIKSAMDKVGSSLESAISDAFSGTKGKDVALNLMKGLSSAAVGLVGGTASRVAASFVPGSKPGEDLGSAVAQYIIQLVSGQAVQTATTVSGDAAIVAALEEIAAIDALNAVKPSIAGFSFSSGGIVPSAAGGWQLPSFAGGTPALLHSREMVLPAHISDMITDAASRGGTMGGGGGDLHLHAAIMDAHSINKWFEGMMAKHGPTTVSSMIRSNSLSPFNRG